MFKNISIFLTGYDLRKGNPGLGPNSFGYWRMLLPFAGRFYEASEKHDLWYCYGGGNDDKYDADGYFLIGCLEASLRNVLAILFSFLYYFLLRIFGFIFFNYK